MKLLINKNVLSALLIFAFALMLAGCNRSGGQGSGGGGGDKKKVVGFSQMENDGPWRIAETKSNFETNFGRGRFGGARRFGDFPRSARV
jgi:ribose transport system substrate-binding protein